MHPAVNTDSKQSLGFRRRGFQSASIFKDSCGNPRRDTTSERFPDDSATLKRGYWLRSWSHESYLWYDEIIDVDPALYATSQAGVADYFKLLKTTENTPSGNPKDRFHFTRNTADYQAESEQGVSANYGAKYALVSASPPRELVITLVESGSPADEAGLSRGTKIVSVDGVDLINGDDAAALNAGLWPQRIGETHEFEIVDPGAGQRRAVSMTSTAIAIDPVPLTEIIDTDSGHGGYLLCTDHIMTAEQDLGAACAEMREANITDLVLDLRYNRGGFLYLANQVAYMIAGAGVSGRTFGALEFNDKNPSTNPVTGQTLSPDRFIQPGSTPHPAPRCRPLTCQFSGFSSRPPLVPAPLPRQSSMACVAWTSRSFKSAAQPAASLMVFIRQTIAALPISPPNFAA